MAKKPKLEDITPQPRARDLMDNIWTDVTITMVYLDRGKVGTRDVRISKEDMEKEHAENARKDGMDVPKDFTVPNEMFQSMVMRAASAMFHSPIIVDSSASNELRMIAPGAVKEVTVVVHNVGQVIVA